MRCGSNRFHSIIIVSFVASVWRYRTNTTDALYGKGLLSVDEIMQAKDDGKRAACIGEVQNILTAAKQKSNAMIKDRKDIMCTDYDEGVVASAIRREHYQHQRAMRSARSEARNTST